MKPQLLIYKEKLRIASIKVDDLRCHVHPLLACLINVGPRTRFFSLTKTKDEVSIVYDSSIDLRAGEGCDIWPQTWRVLTASDGTGPSQLVSELTGPLAETGISVFFSSTYQTDLLMVREDDLPSAITVLSNFFDIVDGETEDAINIPAATSLDERPTETSGPRPIVLVDTGPLRVACCTLESETFVWSLANLIRLVFYSEEPFLFLALVDSALTLVVREETYVVGFSALFGDCGYNTDSALWAAARVDPGPDGGLGYGMDKQAIMEVLTVLEASCAFPAEEAGIVTMYARPLVEQCSIPVYYVSTYLTDYILVERDDIDTAKEAWCTIGVPVLEEKPCHNKDIYL